MIRMDFSFASRKDLVDKILSPNPTKSIVTRTQRGNHLWVVYEISEPHHKTLVLYVLSQDENKQWVADQYHESNSLEYYDCPLTYLDMVPENDSSEWREKVKNHHKGNQGLYREAKNLFKKAKKTGDKIKVILYDGWTISDMILEITNPFCGRHDGKGKLWRVPPRAIQKIEVIGREQYEEDRYNSR